MEKAKTERIKQLLSSYYGNAPGAADQQPGSPASTAVSAELARQQTADAASPSMGAGRLPAGNPISLDSPAFNPEQHIAHIIQTYPIDRLLAEHRGMAREIKNLDSDMQQLVYENYNKFIAATDTIRAMKANVDSMEADMDQLRTNMDVVADRSSAVNTKLLKRRQHIEELNRVQGLLSKLQAVFDLPRRMQAALEEDALDSAVSYYAEALQVLRKYGHKGAFRGVAVQADATAKEISTVLKRRLAERKDDTEHVVLLLRQLGEGDDMLQEKYLQGRRERMQRILQDASAVADAMAAVAKQPLQQRGSSSSMSSSSTVAVDNPESWGLGPDGVVPSLSTFVKALDERLINAMQETVVNMNGIFLQNDRTAARRKPMVIMAKDIVGQYFKLIRRVVSDASMSAVATAAYLHTAGGDKDFSPVAASLNFPDNWGADLVMQAMSSVTTDVGLLHNQLPELSLRDWAAAATEQAVQGHIMAGFAALQERIVSGVKMLCDQLNSQQQGPGQQAQVPPLSQAYNYLCEVIQQGVAAFLKGLRVYEQGKLLAAAQEQLSDAIQAQMQALFHTLVTHFLKLAKVKDGSMLDGSGHSAEDGQDSSATDEPPETGLVLLLAKLCMFMESTTVPYVVEVLAVAFQARGGFRSGDTLPQFVGGEVARRLGTAAHLLISTYVDLHGRSLSQLAQQSITRTNWLSVDVASRPQPVCDLMVEQLSKAEVEVCRLLDSTGRMQGIGLRPEGASHHQRGGSMTDVMLESGAVERGVAKLFRGKVTPFGSSGLKFSQSAVLAAIAIVGLKSLVEYIRLQTLCKAGLQQLQLNVHYMRPKLLQLVGGIEAEPVGQLLEEVVAAAAERSTDPTLLEAVELAALTVVPNM